MGKINWDRVRNYNRDVTYEWYPNEYPNEELIPIDIVEHTNFFDDCKRKKSKQKHMYSWQKQCDGCGHLVLMSDYEAHREQSCKPFEFSSPTESKFGKDQNNPNATMWVAHKVRCKLPRLGL